MEKCYRALPTRVFLLIENRLLRESLARLFRKRSDLAIVGQRSSAHEAPLSGLEDQCDVVLGDCHVLGNLLSAVYFAASGESAAGAKFILIGMATDEQQFMAAVRLGVSGYLLQDASASDVVAAVRSVSRGEAVCPPQMCAALFNFVAQFAAETPSQSSTSRPDLTLRQQQLITLVAKGMTNKEIASQLNLSAFTVRNHIHRILKQVDAESRSEAVEAVRAHGYPIPA
jgi:two-component system nitrate/nitrite response regulator NarL